MKNSSDYNAFKVGMNHKKKVKKNGNTWKLNNILLNNHRVRKIKEEIKGVLKNKQELKKNIRK